jgi:hypothetical protein
MLLVSLFLCRYIPDVLGRVEFGCVGRQADQGEICRKLELSRAMIAGAVEDDHGVSALGHGFADFGEVQVEGMGVTASSLRPAVRVSLPTPACWPIANSMTRSA